MPRRVKLRVLLSYKFDRNMVPLGFQCEAALIALGHEVHRLEVDRRSFFQGITMAAPLPRDEQLVRRAEEVRPDMLFVVIGYNYSAEALETVKKRFNSKIIGWWLESPESYRALSDTAGHYDHLFSFSKRMAASVESEMGLPCGFVNYGTDTGIYRPLKLSPRRKRKYGSGISFLGKYKERRRELLEALAGMDLGIWGPLWKKDLGSGSPLLPHVKGYRLFGRDATELFCASKVNININSWPSPTGPNLRVFDIPACGSFLLTEYVEEIDDLFETGEMESFKCPDELRDKAAYYLSHDMERERIARRGYEKVVRLYKMTDSLSKILKASA